jgi:hypothetical protein
LKFIPSQFPLPMALNSFFSFIKMSDRDLKFVYLFKADIANNPYLMIRSRSEYYTSMSVSGLPTFLISVKNMNLLSSSIYKHLKVYLIKHKQSLILGECGSQHLFCQTDTFLFVIETPIQMYVNVNIFLVETSICKTWNIKTEIYY